MSASSTVAPVHKPATFKFMDEFRPMTDEDLAKRGDSYWKCEAQGREYRGVALIVKGTAAAVRKHWIATIPQCDLWVIHTFDVPQLHE
jgi:hypothetical protein